MTHLTEMLKGVLEGCVLEILAKKESYGYEIITKLRDLGFSTASKSAVYAILKRFQKDGLVKCDVSPSGNGPERKIYSLTPAGKTDLSYFWSRWDFLSGKLGELRAQKSDNF